MTKIIVKNKLIIPKKLEINKRINVTAAAMAKNL